MDKIFKMRFGGRDVGWAELEFLVQQNCQYRAAKPEGAVANEPPTAATTPCLCDVGGCGDIASIYLCKKHFNSVNAVVKMPSSKLAGMEKHPNLKVT
jgi:hypothetical protein